MKITKGVEVIERITYDLTGISTDELNALREALDDKVYHGKDTDGYAQYIQDTIDVCIGDKIPHW